MHLEHFGDYSVWGGYGRWMVSVVEIRVSLEFTYPSKANGTNDSMPRSVVSKLRFDAPMN